MGVEEMECHIQTIDRYINILQSGYKKDKKAALEELRTVVGRADGNVLVDIHSKLQNQLILSFQDPMEVVREGALLLSQTMIERLEVDKTNIALLMPAFPRVCREKDHESSEELRLIIAQLLIVIVNKYDKNVVPYMTEIVDMVCRLLKDPSPDIKQTTSRLLIVLVKALPYETFQYTKKLWPPVVENITHQRWKVRVSTIEAIEWLMLKGDNKCVPDVTPALNKKMLDSMYQVRLALVRLAGHWLVKLPDRYSFFAHLIPMVLSGLADENEDVVREAERLWEEAGELYLKENETDLKDKINYEEETLEHYPEGVKRPSLGCRVLIEREASKFLLALVNELTDWVELVRIKASMLLTQVTLHFEHSITMSIRKIISQICKAARDRDTPLVVANVKQAAEYMGYFIPADVYCQLIVEYMKEANEGELLVVAAMIRGTKRSDLAENLDRIAVLLEHTTFKGKEQLAMLDLIESILKVCQSDSFKVGDQIWACLVSIAGLAEATTIKDKSVELLERFADIGGGNKREVYGRHCSGLLTKIPDTVWTVHCHEQFIFSAMINVAGEIVSDNIDSIMAILRSALKPETDPEVLLRIMMTVNDLLSKPEVTLPNDEVVSKFVRVMLAELLPPHLKWTAGRSAEAIRTVTCTCLYMCLCKVSTQNDEVNTPMASKPIVADSPKKIQISDSSSLPTSGTDLRANDDDDDKIPDVNFSSSPEVIYGLGGYLEPLLPMLMSLIQDPAPKTRLLTLNCVKIFAKNSISHQPQHFATIMYQVLKRLDDADKSVRAMAVEVIKTYYSEHIVRTTKDMQNSTLVDYVYSTLLIHLDDKDSVLKQNILECLKIVSKMNPQSLRSKVLPENFRDKEVCQKLIDFLEESMKSLIIE
uniref:HEAT repeat-containing protein 2 n=1 Tax=Lygus hesperus TaxID=30085 RepID=A0A0A9XLX8_LYGHE